MLLNAATVLLDPRMQVVQGRIGVRFEDAHSPVIVLHGQCEPAGILLALAGVALAIEMLAPVQLLPQLLPISFAGSGLLLEEGGLLVLVEAVEQGADRPAQDGQEDGADQGSNGRPPPRPFPGPLPPG